MPRAPSIWPRTHGPPGTLGGPLGISGGQHAAHTYVCAHPATQEAARSYRWSMLLLALTATLREGIESVLFLTGVSQVAAQGGCQAAVASQESIACPAAAA